MEYDLAGNFRFVLKPNGILFGLKYDFGDNFYIVMKPNVIHFGLKYELCNVDHFCFLLKPNGIWFGLKYDLGDNFFLKPNGIRFSFNGKRKNICPVTYVCQVQVFSVLKKKTYIGCLRGYRRSA